jgi:hypothetical protein
MTLQPIDIVIAAGARYELNKRIFLSRTCGRNRPYLPTTPESLSSISPSSNPSLLPENVVVVPPWEGVAATGVGLVGTGGLFSTGPFSGS